MVTEPNQDYAYDTRTLAYGRRYLRRATDGAERRPFIPFGILPALLLFTIMMASFTTCASQIQAETRKAAEAALAENGFNWASVTVDGQQVTLSGVPPSEAEGKKAFEVVTQKLWKAPLRQARPAQMVTMNYAALPLPVSVTPPSGTVPAAGLANDWTFRVSNGEIFLDGAVPDSQTRQRILDIANQAVNSGRYRSVRDTLTISNRAEPEGYLAVALRGASLVTRCDRATSRFIAKRFSLYCELPRASEAGVRSDATSTLQLGTLGDIEILANESVTDCERALSDLLSGSSIEFATGRATISGSSAAQLDRIARAASDCPGTLRIEGHTDNTGSGAINDSLSQQRADAVRNALIDRGLDARRLEARGFGSREPKADNRSASGRALNRRIEIEVVREPG